MSQKRCFKEITGFREILTSLDTWSGAGEEILQMAVNRQEFSDITTNSNISNIKRDGQDFKLE
jgi:hypothetical protein